MEKKEKINNLNSINSIFKDIKLQNTYDKYNINKQIKKYRRDVFGQLKNFTVYDGYFIRQAPKPPKTRPACLNFLIHGMGKIIFGNNCKYNKKSFVDFYSTERNKNLKTSKVGSCQKSSSPYTSKIKTSSKLSPKRPKLILTKQSDLFITSFNESSSRMLQNSKSDSSNNFKSSILNISKKNSRNRENSFIKNFSKENFSKECNSIYKDNLDLYKKFKSYEDWKINYNEKIRTDDKKKLENDMDKRIFGNINKKNKLQTLFQNKISGINEFIEIPKANLMRFGDNLNKISDKVVINYQNILENQYNTITKEADIQEEEKNLDCVKKDFTNANKNNFKLNRISYHLNRIKQKYSIKK